MTEEHFYYHILFPGLVVLVFAILFFRDSLKWRRRKQSSQTPIPSTRPHKDSWTIGEEAELELYDILTRDLAPLGYTILRDIMLPDRGRTTQIDFIVLHTSGIYVIEAKAHHARIYGHPWQPFWSALYNVFRPMRNPLHQNAVHMGVLGECTGLSVLDCMTSIAAFSPRSRLAFFRPRNVLYFAEVAPFIRSHPNSVGLRPEQISHVAHSLLKIDLSISPDLRAMHGHYDTEAEPPRCPRCGGAMVLRQRRKDNAPFWGCPRFPRCRCTIDFYRRKSYV